MGFNSGFKGLKHGKGDRGLYTFVLEQGQVVETCEHGRDLWIPKKKNVGYFFTI